MPKEWKERKESLSILLDLLNNYCHPIIKINLFYVYINADQFSEGSDWIHFLERNEVKQRLGIIIQDFIDLCFKIFGNFGNNLQSFEIFDQLLFVSSPHYN